MIVKLLDVIIAGLLMGGIYALIAVGLSLQYGVARVLNIAHGEFIMLGAFASWMLFSKFDISPLLSLFFCAPFAFYLGVAIHRVQFKRLLNTSETMDIFESRSMLAAFGLLFIIQNVAILIWGSDLKGYSYMNVGISIAGAIFAANRLVTLGCALIIGATFYLFLARTRLGKAIRAASQNPHSAGLMGVNIDQVLGICFGFGAMMASFAGTLLSMCYPLDTAMGMQYTIIAVIVVALGGLGSIIGSFIGGFILGLIGSIATTIEPALAMIAYYAMFILLLLIKPKGILGK